MPSRISASPETIRLIILETDEAHPETQDRRGSFGNVLEETFTTAGRQHDPPLGVEAVMKFVVEEKGGKVPSVEEFEGAEAVLITGSMYDAHGDDEWILKLLKLLRELWTTRPNIRFSGVCFGHQILCRLLGSTIESTPGSRWELAHTEITLSPIGDRLFEMDTGKLHLHQMHSDHVIDAPSAKTSDLLAKGDRVHVWGSTETTEIQGVYLRERMLTCQAHLELDEKMVKRQIEQREDSGGITKDDRDQADKAKETAGWKHDGVLVAGAILRFFHGDDKQID